jgi:hypothetical protein
VNNEQLHTAQVFFTSRDGNGAPIPDSPRGIPPLGDGDGEGSPPRGDVNGENPPPMGKRGRGWRNIPHPRSPRGPVKLIYGDVFM